MNHPKRILHIGLLFWFILLNGVWLSGVLFSHYSMRGGNVISRIEHRDNTLTDNSSDLPDNHGILTDANAWMRLLMTQTQRVVLSPVLGHGNGHGHARSNIMTSRRRHGVLTYYLKYQSGYKQWLAPNFSCASSSLYIYALRHIIR